MFRFLLLNACSILEIWMRVYNIEDFYLIVFRSGCFGEQKQRLNILLALESVTIKILDFVRSHFNLMKQNPKGNAAIIMDFSIFVMSGKKGLADTTTFKPVFQDSLTNTWTCAVCKQTRQTKPTICFSRSGLTPMSNQSRCGAWAWAKCLSSSTLQSLWSIFKYEGKLVWCSLAPARRADAFVHPRRSLMDVQFAHRACVDVVASAPSFMAPDACCRTSCS